MITRKKRKSGPPRRRPALDGQVHRQAPSQRAALPGLIVVVSIFFILHPLHVVLWSMDQASPEAWGRISASHHRLPVSDSCI